MACTTGWSSTTGDFGQWYRDMTPCWMMAEPFRRRRLILRTHRWIAERVLEPLAHGEEPFVIDLEAHGALAQSLTRTIPPHELEAWQFWVRLALADLRQALASTPSPRNEEWLRWLFLIPYSIPVRGRAARRPRSPWPGDPQKSADLC
jgi:hypothetical protein